MEIPPRKFYLRCTQVAVFLICAFFVEKNLVISGTPQRFSLGDPVQITDGHGEISFELPPKAHLVKIRLPAAAPAPSLTANSTELRRHFLGRQKRSSYSTTYFTLEAPALCRGENTLRISVPGGFNGAAKVIALQYAGHIKESVYLLFSDFGSGPPTPKSSNYFSISTFLLYLTLFLTAAHILFLFHDIRRHALVYSWIYILTLGIIFPVHGMRLAITPEAFAWSLILSLFAVLALSFRKNLEALENLRCFGRAVDLMARSERILQIALTPRKIAAVLMGLLGLYYLVNYIFFQRMPLGHDTGSFLQLHYMFLNDAVTKGELPMWLPFMTKGTVGNLWLYLQNNFLTNVYYLAAPVLQSCNDYYLFYLSMYADEIIFGLGMLLLSLELYSSPWAVMFAVLTSVFSSVWGCQIWFNLRLYYLLPFIFYFSLRFLRTGLWRHFLLSMLMLPLSMFGNVPYFISVLSMVTFLFYLLAVILMWQEVKKRFFPVFYGKAAFISFLKASGILAFSAALMGLLYYCVRYGGVEAIRFSNVARSASGKVSLADFLTYGGDLGWGKFLALFTGFPANPDQMLYAGTMTLVFFLMYLYFWFKGERICKTAHLFFILAALMVSFITGGIFARIAYFSWPTMDMFRHIGLLGGIFRILLIILAAYGLDILISRFSSHGKRVADCLKALLYTVTLITGLKAIIMIQGKANYLYFSAMELRHTLWWDLALTLLFLPLVLAGISLYRRGYGAAKPALLVLPLFLSAHAADILSYRSLHDSAIMPSVSDKTIGLFKFGDYPYMPVRKQAYFENRRFSQYYLENMRGAPLTRDRFPSFLEMKDKGRIDWKMSTWPYGASYWSLDNFVYFDACYTAFRTDHRLKVVSDFYSCYIKKFIPFNLESPIPSHPAFRKLIGCGFPKLQVFRRIHIVPGAAELRAALSSQEYRGDIIFSDRETQGDAEVRHGTDKPAPLAANDRVEAEITVEDFSLSRLILTVDNPRRSKAVLYYGDAWHKNWKAYVDGNETPIYPANIAFKAIEIPPGLSRIEFHYSPKLLSRGNYALILFSTLMLAVLITAFLRRSAPTGRDER